ncbi:hypothetical protein O1L55_08120 [Streptomyces albulus]|nr:hypothetical protein [Streptomyces noursei]
MEESRSAPDGLAVRTTPASARRPPAAPRPTAHPLPWLALTGAAFTLLQLVLVVPGTGLGWDETVYASQVARDVPAAFFSAPRARGITYLIAPVAALTSATTALRLALAVLSGVGLWAALRVWRPLLPTRVLVLAGALFATLWITLYYGPQVMPNLWSAYGALAATGCFLRSVRDRTDRRALVRLPLAVAVVALMRPPDAGWLVLVPAVAALAVPRWRRPALVVLLAAGLLLGAADWIVEAYTHYGGLLARLDRAAEIQGGIGWHPALDDQIRSLDGRGLCRPCDVPWSHPYTAAWFLRCRCSPPSASGSRCGPGARPPPCCPPPSRWRWPCRTSSSSTTPRPASCCPPTRCCPCPPPTPCGGRPPRGRFRPRATALLAVVLAAHLAVQGAVLTGNTARNRHMRADFTAAADALHLRGCGRPACSPATTPCSSPTTPAAPPGRPPGPTPAPPGGLRAAAARRPVALLVPPGDAAPAFARDWRPVPLTDSGLFRGYRAYLPPAQRTTAGRAPAAR